MITTRNMSTLSVLISLCVGTAQADFVGLNIGANHWTPDLTGSFGSVGESQIDLTTDLGLDEPAPSNLVLILEHPIPLLPKVDSPLGSILMVASSESADFCNCYSIAAHVSVGIIAVGVAGIDD